MSAVATRPALNPRHGEELSLQYKPFALRRNIGMASDLIFFISLTLISVTCDTSWIPVRWARQLTETSVSPELPVTEKELSPEVNTQTMEQNASSRSDSNFWLPREEHPEDTSTVSQDAVTQLDMVTQNETLSPGIRDKVDKQEPLGDPEWEDDRDMEQTIFLPRTNCNLELRINRWEDRRVKVQYENLKKGMFGQCQTTLYGNNGILLAVRVSSVRFNGGNDKTVSEEVLRVISNVYNFTIIEYRGGEEYYPLLLTDSDRVFLSLAYNGTRSSLTRTSFNLEVFNYYKNENKLNLTLQDEKIAGYGNSSADVENIFITTTAGP